jgi:hypothetical protein
MKSNLEKILMQKTPCFHLVKTSEKNFLKIFFELKNKYDENLFFIELQGQKMKIKKTFFNEFNKSLKFPNYFGNNWDAFDECINDLSWMDFKKNGCIFFISRSLSLLKDENINDFSIFINIIKDMVSSKTKSKNKFFHFIFQECEDRFIEFKKKINFYFLNSELSIYFV